VREGLVAVDVGPDILPEFLKDNGGACKVECDKVGMGEDMLDGLCRRAGYELDDGGREAGFQQNLVDDVVGIGGCWRRFPDDDVAYENSERRVVLDRISTVHQAVKFSTRKLHLLSSFLSSQLAIPMAVMLPNLLSPKWKDVHLVKPAQFVILLASLPPTVIVQVADDRSCSVAKHLLRTTILFDGVPHRAHSWVISHQTECGICLRWGHTAHRCSS
jgi:hypothetical protein